uniref:DUF2948 family protein n=2 Tax=Aureimonas frigidaquae TaxID=424757 RepID=A0A0P0Z1S7_9HYPH|nr:hypothetical protein [Aureimonas frigidaquae]
MSVAESETMSELHLMALDEADLQIISACCQDAVMKRGDVRFEEAAGRFILVMNRYAWEAAAKRRGLSLLRRPVKERRRSVLHFDRVTKVRQQNVSMDMADEVLSLLAIRFHVDEAPSGVVELVFAGNATIRLHVECIEAQLADLGAAWSTELQPDHERG